MRRELCEMLLRRKAAGRLSGKMRCRHNSIVLAVRHPPETFAQLGPSGVRSLQWRAGADTIAQRKRVVLMPPGCFPNICCRARRVRELNDHPLIGWGWGGSRQRLPEPPPRLVIEQFGDRQYAAGEFHRTLKSLCSVCPPGRISGRLTQELSGLHPRLASTV